MARWRHQLPAYSQVSLASLWSGFRAALGRDAEPEVLEVLNTKFSPKRIVLTDSGTSALQLGIRAALAVRPGRVALPAYSCFDVSTAAEGADARVLLYDVEPRSLSPDSNSLERAIRRGATVVVIAHLYGVPVDVGALIALRDRHDFILIEDAAQGVGAAYGGTDVGKFGDLSVLSFARGKGMTGGGGGALLARSTTGPGAPDVLISPGSRGAGWKQLVRAAAVWLLARPSLYGLVAALPLLRLGETIYRDPAPSAGIPRATLGVLRKTFDLSVRESQVRKKNAAELTGHIDEHAGALASVQPTAGSEPGYLRLPVLVSREFDDHERTWARRLGVAAGYPMPLSRLPSCRRICENADENFPGAELLAAHLVTLPTHSRLTRYDTKALSAWIRGRT